VNKKFSLNKAVAFREYLLHIKYIKIYYSIFQKFILLKFFNLVINKKITHILIIKSFYN